MEGEEEEGSGMYVFMRGRKGIIVRKEAKAS